LAEHRHKLSAGGDANLALFRKQASIIALKKEGTLATLNAVTKELADVKAEYAKKEANSSNSANSKILLGDEFKRYVSELRGKSTTYKRKKVELSSLIIEHGILARTHDVRFN
jgi:intraflagellar transport protein 81